METPARKARGLLAALTGVLALASCVATPASSSSMPDASGQFVRHPDAIETLPSPEPGPGRPPSDLELVPVGDCVLGLDNQIAGPRHAGVTWIGTPGCTRLELSPRPEPTGDRLPTGALLAYSAVPTADGAVVGIGDYPVPERNGTLLAAPSLWRREPDGSVREVVRIPMQWYDDWIPGTQASDVVRMGQQLFVVGADVVDGGFTPVVWTSDDGGATLSRLRLPKAPDGHPPSNWRRSRVPARIATDGQLLLATALSPDEGVLWTWRSADGGRTWQVSAASTPPGSPLLENYQVIDVTKVAGRWLLFSSSASSSLVLSSPDGARWTIETSPGVGGNGVVTGVSVDHRGELVMIGNYPGAVHYAGKNSSVDRCDVVWSGQLGALRRQEFGCARGPGFSSVTTIADGRVLIVKGTDLWIRG